MASYTALQNGSTGSEVKKLQQALIDAGYNVGKSGVDGIYGNDTAAAVKQYQQKYGLTANGVADSNMRDLLYEQTGVPNISTSSTAPTGGSNNGGTVTGGNNSNLGTNSAPTTSNTGATTTAQNAYTESDTVKQAQALLQQQLANKPGAYQSQWQEQLSSIISNIQNRDAFSYDLNSDALYQQYLDQYATQGKMAMMDTMGQAAALTGGYGNSYAQMAGQQAYQGYLQQLNEVVPELYGLALDQYNQEGQRLYDQAALMAQMEDQDYGRYRDSLSDYYAELDRLTEDARYQGELDYGKWIDNRDYEFALQQYRDSQQASSGGSGSGNGSGGYSSETAKTQQMLKDAGYNIEVDGAWGPKTQAAYDDYISKNEDGPGITDDTGGVSDSIKDKASGFTTNEDLANYLDGLTSSGKITEAQADALYAEYKQVDKAALNKRSWTLVDDGGVNWLWGVDNNATVKDQYGNTYRLDKLVNALVADGMSKDEAKTYVKNLQARLGA